MAQIKLSEEQVMSVYDEVYKKGLEYIENSDASYLDKIIAINRLPMISAFAISQQFINIIQSIKGKEFSEDKAPLRGWGD